MSATYINTSDNHLLTKTISITSGKGGVGKTSIVSNMAIHLGQQGNKVLVLDGDFGMANLDIMFGVKPTNTLEKVISGEMTLRESIVEVAPNVHLIPGGSGLYELQNMTLVEKQLLLDQINALEGKFNVMLIDTAPGIDDNVLYLNSAAQEIVVVLTPDPASLVDTYALIKVLNQKYKEDRFSIICNMVKDENESLRIFRRLSDLTSRFLCVSLDYKGFIPNDPDFRKATKSQQLVLSCTPRCPSSFAIKGIAEKINNFGHLGEIKGGMQFFWQQFVGVA